MIACPGCGHDAPEGAATCSSCGARLTAPSGPSRRSEERRTVTTLFCDIVGFTKMSEAADPEDVDRLLGEYAARTRAAIEAHGGTVEKFIGDAVVAVFGVPPCTRTTPSARCAPGCASCRRSRA